MPGHRAHDALTVAAAAATVPVYYVVASHPDTTTAAILAVACLISGMLFSPDLDLPSRSRRRWGPAGCLWAPYERLVSHRSWVSHSIVAGPLIRLLYFGLVTYGLAWALLWAAKEWLVPLDRNALMRGWRHAAMNFVDAHPTWVTAALLGFILGGLVHTIADVAWSARPWRRRRRRRRW
jgi:uncharacterized metal-binding protein